MPAQKAGPKKEKLQIEWQMIDAKASRMMKVSHQVQVTFYCLAFEAYLAEHAAAYPNVEFVASAEGGVWLPSDWSKPKLF